MTPDEFAAQQATAWTRRAGRLGHRADRASPRCGRRPTSRSTRPARSRACRSTSSARCRCRPTRRRRDRRRRDRGLRLRPARPRRHRRRSAVEPRAHPARQPDPALVGGRARRSTCRRSSGMVQQPPIRKLGVFELDQFFPPDDRMELAMKLNGLLASPSFAAWGDGPAARHPVDAVHAGRHGRAARSSRPPTCPTRSASSSRRWCCRSSSRGCAARAAPPTCGRCSTWTRSPATCRRRPTRRRRSRS